MASAPQAGSRKQKQKPIGHHAKLCWLISRWCGFKAALQCAWSRTTACLSMAADTHWWLHSTRPSLTTHYTVWFENSHHCAAGQQCYTEKATKAWHREGTQQDKEHLQSTQTTVNRHSSQNKNRPPSNEEPPSQGAQHPPAQKPCTPPSQQPLAITGAHGHHHTDPAASSPESSEPTRLSARRKRAEPHYHADTIRTNGEMRHPAPRPRGARHHEEPVVSHGRMASLSWGDRAGGEGGKGE